MVERIRVEPHQGYSNVRVLSSDVDTNLLAATGRFVAIPWDIRGGRGAFAVVDSCSSGLLGSEAPLFLGHRSAVVDVAFNPFSESVVASASDNDLIKLWGVADRKQPPITLACDRRVCRIVFNPLVSDALASFEDEGAITLWDI
jgi:coronin-1B/1C/6